MVDFEKGMILRFLQRNYPIYRLKHNMRFKRTIILDDGQHYFLSDKEHQARLFYELLNIIGIIFYSDETLNQVVVKEFLHIK